MLSNIIFSINAVLPLVILMVLGFCLKREKLGLFKNPEDFFNQIDRFVFHVALPVYIFNEIAGARVENIFNPKLAVYCVSGILLSFLILTLTVPVFIKKKATRGAFIHGIYRSNFAILGVSLAKNLFGDLGSSTAALIMPFAIPLYNVLAVVILTVNAEDTENPGNNNNLGKIILGIIKNPLIIAVILALPFMILKVSFPQAIHKSVSYIANTSTPLALMSLGAGIDLRVLKTKGKLSLIASLIKTVICPVVFIIPAVLLGFRDAALVVIFVIFAAPTAVGTYIMAKNMKSDYELAGQIIVLTTLICPFTVFFGSFILKSLGLI